MSGVRVEVPPGAVAFLPANATSGSRWLYRDEDVQEAVAGGLSPLLVDGGTVTVEDRPATYAELLDASAQAETARLTMAALRRNLDAFRALADELLRVGASDPRPGLPD